MHAEDVRKIEAGRMRLRIGKSDKVDDGGKGSGAESRRQAKRQGRK